MLKKARQEAFDIVAEARRFADEIKQEMKELRDMQENAPAANAEMTRRQQVVRRKLRQKRS